MCCAIRIPWALAMEMVVGYQPEMSTSLQIKLNNHDIGAWCNTEDIFSNPENVVVDILRTILCS